LSASQVAFAWLLQRSPKILLIPGTSSVKHLQENLNAATLHIPSGTIADLDPIGGGAALRRALRTVTN
jgi:aryl-alcohol dehydrogenase-like predicted oxidoreductase